MALRDHETVHDMPGGGRAAIRILRAPSAVAEFIALRVEAREIDDQDGTIRELPAHMVAQHGAPLVSGELTVDQAIVREQAAAIDRLATLRVAAQAFAHLPEHVPE